MHVSRCVFHVPAATEIPGAVENAVHWGAILPRTLGQESKIAPAKQEEYQLHIPSALVQAAGAEVVATQVKRL